MPELRPFLDGGGHMGALIREHRWEDTPLGPIHGWPQSLRSALSICLRSPTATAICWGSDFRFLYNDPWSLFLGERHPAALGRPASEVMADVWPVLDEQFRTVVEKGESVNVVDILLVRNLGGRTYDSYWSYSLLPVASEDGTVGGILAQAQDTTERVLRARRDALLLELSDRLRRLSEPAEVIAAGVEIVGNEIRAGRIGYAEVDEGGETLTILHCRNAPDTVDICGTYPLEGAGAEVHRDLSAGRTSRMDDVSKHIHDEEMREAYAAAQIASSLTVPVISGEKYRAMLFAHDARPHQWTEHDETMLRDATQIVWREISRVRAEVGLRRSEERYRRLFEQANDLIFILDFDQIITDVNPAGAAALELSREELIGRSQREFVTDSGFEQGRRMLLQKLERGGTTQHVLDVISASGKQLTWEINSTLTVDEAGSPIGVNAIARDITDRRRAEERQRLLVNELNHRVKNTLALVQGLALQSFREARDPAEARVAFQQRLAALAAAHDLLTRESWEGATLGELARGALGHLNAQEERILAQGPEVTLGPKAAVSLVMALHELATNAAKYGALSTPAGRIALRWSIDGKGLGIEWRETGGPAVAAPQRRGFGLRMIERALAADLGGQVTMEFAPEGLVCRIDASRSAATEEEGA